MTAVADAPPREASSCAVSVVCPIAIGWIGTLAVATPAGMMIEAGMVTTPAGKVVSVTFVGVAGTPLTVT